MTPRIQQVHANGVTINVATAGTGRAIVLLHGFPHTWQLWSAVIPELALTRQVIAPDLRGLGGSSRADDGYDALTLSLDVEALLDAMNVQSADIVGIDLGMLPCLALATRAPERVRKLVVMEAVAGALPGAESFLAAGPPWWFGFHAVPGLAETVLLGHEAAYLDFFYRSGTHDGAGIDRAIRDLFIDAYTGSESLRAAFAHYRALPASSQQIVGLLRSSRLTVPTLTVGAHPVGDALFRQLEPLADRLIGAVIADCGHIIPLDRPDALLTLLNDFLD